VASHVDWRGGGSGAETVSPFRSLRRDWSTLPVAGAHSARDRTGL